MVTEGHREIERERDREREIERDRVRAGWSENRTGRDTVS